MFSCVWWVLMYVYMGRAEVILESFCSGTIYLVF